LTPPASSTRLGDGAVARHASNRSAGRRPRLRWSVGRLAAAVTVGIAVAALTGAWTSRTLSGIGQPKAPTTRVVDAGPAQVVVPAAWEPAAPDAALAGPAREQLAVLSASAAAPTLAVVTFGAAADRSLIPGAMRALVPLALLQQPRVGSLAGRPAWVYRALDTSGRRLVMDVTVLPTTAGVLAVGCAWPADFRGGGRDCASSVKSVSVRGAATLTPSRSVALAAELPAAIAGLDHKRADGRAALSRARTPNAQAAAAHRLARQHLAAAEQLRTAFGTAARPLIAGLEDSGHAYAALGTAASDGASARFRAARREIRIAETKLAGGIDRARKAGARATDASASTSPPATRIEPARPVVTKLVVVMLVLLASAAAGFIASGPAAEATSRLWRSTRRPVPRRARG
jgi:hypothetical protein